MCVCVCVCVFSLICSLFFLLLFNGIFEGETETDPPACSPLCFLTFVSAIEIRGSMTMSTAAEAQLVNPHRDLGEEGQ